MKNSTFKRVCVYILIFLCSIFQPTNAQTKVVDSLKHILKQSTNDSILMDTYNKLRRATYYSNQKESKGYAEKFLEYAEKRQDSPKIAFANFYIGNSYYLENQYNEALSHYLKTLKHFEDTDDKMRMPSVINAIGSIYDKKEEYETALTYYNQSVSLSKETKDKRRTAIALINVGNVYKKLEEYTKGIHNYNEAIAVLDTLRTKQPSEITRTQQIYQGAKLNLAATYLDNNTPDKAREIYDYIHSNIDSIQDKHTYGYALQGYGDFYFQTGDFSKSIKPYEQALKIFKDNNYEDDAYQIMPNLINVYQKNKKFEKGLLLYYEYNATKDSLFNIDKDRALTETMQKFEVAKKEQLIAEKNLEIERSKTRQNLLILGVISLLVLTFSLVTFYRKRLKYRLKIIAQEKTLQDQEITRLIQENKITAMDSMISGQEQERARIAKDLHDSLGGLLSSVKSYFEASHRTTNIKENSIDKTASLIDEASSEVRRISHNMMPHALSIAGLKEAISDIAERLENEKYNVTVEVSDLPQFDNTEEIMIYRLVQELVYNIKKHAQASSIFIQIFSSEGRIHLTVEDDGIGFEAPQEKHKKGLGLQSIESRVAYLNGSILWDSQLGKGTSVHIDFLV